jgi:hypothetical protein
MRAVRIGVELEVGELEPGEVISVRRALRKEQTSRIDAGVLRCLAQIRNHLEL